MKQSKSGRHPRDPKNADNWKFMIIFKPWKWRKQKARAGGTLDPGGGGDSVQRMNSTPGECDFDIFGVEKHRNLLSNTQQK